VKKEGPPLPEQPRLTIPQKLAVVTLAVGTAGALLSGCPQEPGGYFCNSDAALAIVNSDASPDPQHDRGFITDGGASCEPELT
jgi:hypothetical protein